MTVTQEAGTKPHAWRVEPLPERGKSDQRLVAWGFADDYDISRKGIGPIVVRMFDIDE